MNWLMWVAHAAPLPSDSHPSSLLTSLLVALLFGGGGFAAFFKVRSENRKLKAEARKYELDVSVAPIELAQGAVVVQSTVIKDLHTVIKDLQEQLTRQSVRIAECELTIVNLREELRIAKMDINGHSA